MNTMENPKWVVLLKGQQLGIFDDELEAQMFIDNTPEAKGAKAVEMSDPWKRRGVEAYNLEQPKRADKAVLYLLDADGHLLAKTETGHLLIVSEEDGETRAGILVPVREGGKTSFKSLPDELLVPRLAEAYAKRGARRR